MELLPCPFCGRQPRLTTRPSTMSEVAPWMAFLACFCGGYSARAHQAAPGGTEADAVNKVTTQWNTRAPAGAST